MRWLLLALLGCGAGEALVADAGPDQLWGIDGVVTLDGMGSTGAVSHEWHLPDGSVVEGEQVGLAIEGPGRFVVRLEVKDRQGSSDSDTMLVRAATGRGSMGSSRLVSDGAGHLAATVADLDQVVVVDMTSRVVARVYPTCEQPRGVSLGIERLFVACGQDQVQSTELLSGSSVTWSMPWGSRPSAVLVHEERVFVALEGEDRVAELDDDGGIAGSFAVPDPVSLIWHNGGVLAGSMRGGTLGTMDRVIVLSPSLGPDSDTDARGTPNYLTALASTPDGEVLVGGLKQNLQRGLVRDGLALTPETASRAMIRVLSADGTDVDELAFDNRDRVSAIAYNPHGDLLFVGHGGSGIVDVLDAVTYQRLGGWTNLGVGIDGLVATEGMLWILVSHERELLGISLNSLTGGPEAIVHRIDLLQGLAEPLDAQVLEGKKIFHDASDRRMSLDSYLSCASCHLDGGDDGQVWDFTDRGEGLRNTRTLRGGVSGPLHWSANFDEIQDFEGDIRGGQGGHGFLADADWDATSDSLGAPKAGLSPELDALAAYVASIPPLRSPHRNDDGTMTVDGLAGEQVFADSGCGVCHGLPSTTDSAWVNGQPVLHDVGTITADSGSRLGQPLTGIDTPSLRGLFATAPYLHDGSALTLADVFEPPGDHATYLLDGGDLPSLEAYLLQLE